MHNLKVCDLMATDLIVLKEDESLDLAEEVMKLARVRHLPVVSSTGRRLVGIVTHRDLLRAQVSNLAGLSRQQRHEIQQRVPVTEVMVRDVETISPHTRALEAARRLRRHKYGCLPVVDNEVLVGIITEADFLDLAIRVLGATEG